MTKHTPDTPHIDEPPVAPDDTQPKGSPPSAEPPVGPDDTAPSPAAPARGCSLLLATVMLGTLCICLTLITFTGIAGYRDGLATNDARNAQATADDILDQYRLGQQDLASGNLEGAIIRFEAILNGAPPDSPYAEQSRYLLSTAVHQMQQTPLAQVEAQYNRGVEQLAAGHPAQAAYYFRWIVESVPTPYARDSADLLATAEAQALATAVAAQYSQGLQEIESGHPATAAARFAWIVATVEAPPAYARDSATQWAIAQTAAVQALTPRPSATRPAMTGTASPAPASATPSIDPEELWDQASMAMRFTRYEEAIEWLETLRAVAPDYSPAETKAMYLDALTKQAQIYLRGQNDDGRDMLARGVRLAQIAADLGDDSLLYEADFVERYLNARNFIAGGQYAATLPILQRLCEENCAWSYRGVSVRDLLEQAQAGSSS